MLTFGGTSTHAYTRTQARGAMPEVRRVADTTSHGFDRNIFRIDTTMNHCSKTPTGIVEFIG